MLVIHLIEHTQHNSRICIIVSFNILPDTDMKNGGFRNLLGVGKVRKC